MSFNFLPNFLKLLNTNLPELKFELTEPIDQNHEKLLLSYQTDIAFSRDKIKNININSFKISSESICLVVPSNHWFNKKSISNLNKLKDEKFIISGLHEKTFFASLLRSFFNKHNFEPKIIIESDFGGMILNLVSTGLGVSILPQSFEIAKTQSVRFIELEEEIDLFIHWRKNEPNNTIKQVVKYAEMVKI
ncbi:LysR family transcriptional regulator substrate-binding protein [Arenibacter latericius]|uniref:LysR family transcriptional regulator substrate-binding protein n=1 Tax=Arenibacter latericius TaxID=86104 RepID=UPI001F0AA6CD|nr:LysR family transcriptional regulator substrate-binding protein [Arenibacter latericius]